MNVGIRGFEKLTNEEPSDDEALLLEGKIFIKQEIFGFNFLEKGLNEGNFSIYLFYGKPKKNILKNLNSKFDIKLERENMFWIDSEGHSEGNNVINCDLNNPFTISLALKQLLPTLKKKRILINVINPFLLMRKPVIVYQFVMHIISLLKVYKCPAILLFQEEQMKEKLSASFQRLVDCVIDFVEIEEKKKNLWGLL